MCDQAWHSSSQCPERRCWPSISSRLMPSHTSPAGLMLERKHLIFRCRALASVSAWARSLSDFSATCLASGLGRTLPQRLVPTFWRTTPQLRLLCSNTLSRRTRSRWKLCRLHQLTGSRHIACLSGLMVPTFACVPLLCDLRTQHGRAAQKSGCELDHGIRSSQLLSLL